jgi:hypothetical protein
MQSLDSNTLEAIKRDNISLDTYEELQHRFTRADVDTYTDIVLGLPGETYESFVSGVDRLIENGQHNRIIFHNCSILPNAEMGDPAYQKKYGIETVTCSIIQHHYQTEEMEDDVQEIQELVIATATMPRADWRRVRAFSWMTSLLHFDRLLQVPLVVTRGASGMRYGKMIEGFCAADPQKYPEIASINTFFDDFALRIQNGGEEYVFSSEFLKIYWQANKYIYVKFQADDGFDVFYDEARDLLFEMMGESEGAAPAVLLDEAIALNRAMVKLPTTSKETTVETSYDIYPFYRAILTGERATPRKKNMKNLISSSGYKWTGFDDWCRQLIKV